MDETRHYALRALEVASTGGIPEQIAMAQANLAWVAWREGNLDETQKLGRAALDSWQRGQWVYAFHWTARFPLLAVALERDQVSDALEHARVMLDPQQQQLPEAAGSCLGSSRAGRRSRPGGGSSRPPSARRRTGPGDRFSVDARDSWPGRRLTRFTSVTGVSYLSGSFPQFSLL